jgi:hypothetical protein
MAALQAAGNDARATFHWHDMEQADIAARQGRWLVLQPSLLPSLRAPWHPTPGRFPIRSSAGIHRDWSIHLGTAGTAPAMYPAKFTFDTTANPISANDFVVFPVHAVESARQANIVAFNDLYGGTIGTTNRICNGRATPAGDADVKTSPTVYWSSNVSKIGGAVTISPVLSLDGNKRHILFFAQEKEMVARVFNSVLECVSRVEVSRLIITPDRRAWELIR